MSAEQLNTLLTGVIAFAGLMQGIFACCLFYNAKQQRNINRYLGILSQYRDLGDNYMFFLKEESKITNRPITVDDSVKKQLVDGMKRMDDLVTILRKKALGRKLENILNISKD